MSGVSRRRDAAPARREILVNGSPWETRVAVLEDGIVQTVQIENVADRGGLVGNIYLGKVTRVLPGLQSAFVDIGQAKGAFLHVADLPVDTNSAPTPTPPVPIEQRVYVGQTLLVQVLKDPVGTKGARVSMRISLAGRLLVLLPHEHEFGVSQKIARAERVELRERLPRLLDAGDGCGFILRTQGEQATDDELAADAAELRVAWAAIEDGAKRQPPKTLLHRDPTLLQRVLRDLVTDATAKVLFDSSAQWEEMIAFAERTMPDLKPRLQRYDEAQPIFEQHGVEAELRAALGRKVGLPSGGHLVIDQLEALTVIDVNTGTFVGHRQLAATILRTNLEAAREAARQLRLRNLGGIVVVDFIDMQSAAHQDQVLAALHEQLARDAVKTTVGPFSALGLVELTRKRTRESLAQQLCETCAACHGQGRVPSARTVSYKVLRTIDQQFVPDSMAGLRVLAAQPVVEWLHNHATIHLDALRSRLGVPITLLIDPSLRPDDHAVVLL